MTLLRNFLKNIHKWILKIKHFKKSFFFYLTLKKIAERKFFTTTYISIDNNKSIIFLKIYIFLAALFIDRHFENILSIRQLFKLHFYLLFHLKLIFPLTQYAFKQYRKTIKKWKIQIVKQDIWNKTFKKKSLLKH